jgi:hypothetical protein
VVSPFGGIGGRLGRGRPPGGWPKAMSAFAKSAITTVKATAGISGLGFLFIVVFVVKRDQKINVLNTLISTNSMCGLLFTSAVARWRARDFKPRSRRDGKLR